MLEKVDRIENSLAKCDGVVGVSSHDKVYFRSMINIDCAPSEAPFAGTPLKKKNPTRPILSNLSPDENDLISKIGMLNVSSSTNKIDKEMRPKDRPKEHANVEDSQVQNDVRKKQTNAPSCTTDGCSDLDRLLETEMKRIDDLTTEGKIQESLNLLLELVDNADLKGPKKLVVHKKIASRAIRLFEWHKDLH